MRNFLLAVSLASVLAGVASPCAYAGNWGQWRQGPSGIECTSHAETSGDVTTTCIPTPGKVYQYYTPPAETPQDRYNRCVDVAMHKQRRDIGAAADVCMYVEKQWFDRTTIINHCVVNAMPLLDWPDEKVRPGCEMHYDQRVIVRE